MPTEPHLRGGLRGYRAAMRGIADDLGGTGASLTVDFLPGGAPEPHEQDRTGTVVATRWGEGPVFVLAEGISLRAAWQLLREQWPTRLSDAHAALARVVSVPEH
jgi:hypothetical protein